MTLWGLAVALSSTFGPAASLRTFVAKPELALALAIVAVLGVVIGLAGFLRVESFRKAERDDNERTRRQISADLQANVQTIMEAMRRSHADGPRSDGSLPVISSASGEPPDSSGAVAPSEARPATRARIGALPSGVDAMGEVVNAATNEPVLLVQTQHDGGGASLLLFTWDGFDLVPAAEVTNATGASFDVTSDQEGLMITTLDTDQNELLVHEYRYGGGQPQRVRSLRVSGDEVQRSFSKPHWATDLERVH